MTIDKVLEKLKEIKEKVGGDYDLYALDEKNNTYEFKDIIHHEGLDLYGIKFE